MILAETQYETHNGELLAIIEVFQTWKHYQEGCKHGVLVLTDHNNLQRFRDTKSLSSKLVRWAQELSRYHFRIDYWQSKANGAADALSWYPQRSAEEEETLQAENTKILHRLQSPLARVSGLSISGMSVPGTKQQVLSSLHQVLIYGIVVLPQLRQFWDIIRSELADEGPYTANIGAMRMMTRRLRNWGRRDCRRAGKISRRCSIIKAFRTSRNSFVQNWSAGGRWSFTSGQRRPTSRAVMFTWHWKQWGASPSVERPIHGFCDGSSNLSQLEGW